MATKSPGEGRRRITPGDRLLARSLPTTGDGWTFGQKPQLSETNLGQPSRPLLSRVPRWLVGRHRKAE